MTGKLKEARPPDPVYYVVRMDGIMPDIKQSGRYVNKCICLAILNIEKDGTWACKAGDRRSINL
jgi:transposase-like protein